MPAPPPVVAAVPQPAPVAVAAPVPEAVKPQDDLPTVSVEAHPFHTVREDESLPVPTVTLMTREGKVIARATPRPTPPSSAAPAAASQPILPARLGGNAQPVGGARLSVGGNTLQLFGVLTPLAKQCSLGTGAPQPCSEAARQALKARLEGNAIVTCEMPPGQRGPPSFICRDWSGIDLGGFLVGEGLALADTSSSPNYLGAQDVARTYQRGIWHAR
jgi:endonuclease YncB( thermonuclease family)